MGRQVAVLLIILFISISCEKEIYIGVNESLPTTFGKIYVSSNPKGYKIFIDDKKWEVTTPDTASWITEGQHKLTLKQDFFSDSSTIITISKNKIQILALDMMKNPRFWSHTTCNSNPQGADIYLNDQPTGVKTPATINKIYPGIYELRLAKKDFRDDSINVVFKGGENLDIYRELEDTTRIVSYRTSNSKISSNQLWRVVVDRNNNKWIGSTDHGLIKFDGKKWTSYENIGVIPDNNVQALIVDKTGKLWIGTSKGLAIFDGISWQSITNNLPSESVTDFEEDISGNIWIATLGGLVKYYNNSFQVYTTQNTGVPLDSLTSISSSKTGEIWIGSSTSGIIRFDGSQWSRYVTADMKLDTKNVSDIITDILVDDKSTVWAYHKADEPRKLMRALVRYDGVKWMEINLSILFYLEGYSFYLDNANNIWMSANGGLIKYNDTKPLVVYDHNTYGFISKHCTSFIIDNNGDGWLTTLGGGIAKLKKGYF